MVHGRRVLGGSLGPGDRLAQVCTSGSVDGKMGLNGKKEWVCGM